MAACGAHACDLLMEVGRGVSSVHRACRAARGAVDEGSTCPDLAALSAMAGPQGERELQRWVMRQPWRRLLPSLYEFPCSKWRGPLRQVQPATHACLLPHEVFGTLGLAGPALFLNLMGSRAAWAEYWAATVGSASVDPFTAASVAGAADGAAASVARAASVAGEPAAGNASAASVAGSAADPGRGVAAGTAPRLFVPLGLHGDDAGVAAGEKVLILTWGALTLPKAATLDTRIVFTMLKASEAGHGASVQSVAYKVLVWSFKALARGVYPECDHDGAPFGQDHHPKRARLAGQPLTLLGGQPVGGRWHEMRGDWKFLRESLHLRQHYGCKGRVCHLCHASRTPGPQYMGDFSRAASHRSIVTQAEFAKEQRATGHPTPLLEIPGFNFRRVFFDVMHTLDLGVLQVAVPSALHELVDEGVFGARRLPLDARLLEATAAYHRWCAENRPPAMAKQFTQAWVKLPHPRISQMQAKAAATRSLAYWLREACAPLKKNSRASKVRWAFFEWTCRADELMRRAGRHLTPRDRAELARRTEAALACYAWLNHRASARGMPLWKVLPKHHAWTHVAYDNMGTNPRSVHCYSDEDVVGKMKRLYNACHATTAPRRSMQRYALLQSLRWLQALRKIAPQLRQRAR